MEAREVADPRRVLCIFGRSPDGLPHKVISKCKLVHAYSLYYDSMECNAAET